MYKIHDGYHEFGRGETPEEAIMDAIKNATWCDDAGEWQDCTREWIDEQIAIGEEEKACGAGLVMEEFAGDE